MQSSKLSQWVTELSTKMSRHLLIYWRDQPYVLKGDSLNFIQTEPEALSAMAKVTILARRHYQEFLKTYPLTDISELKAVLAQEYADCSWVLHQYDRSESNQTRVCTFVLDPKIVAACPGWVFFPETLLLASAYQAAGYKDKMWDCAAQQGFFFYCANGLPISQKVGPLCLNTTMFALNNGLPESLSAHTLSDQAYIHSLLSGLRHCIGKGQSFGCWVIHQTGLSEFSWRKWIILTGSTLIAYLLAVSLYMTLSIEWRKSAIADLGTGVNVLLDSQNRQQQLADSYNSLAASRADAKNTAQLWVLLQSMLADQVSLSSFSLENEKLVFRGSAGRATDVLAKLLQSPYVKTAEFSAPVRNDNGTEVFVISVILNDSMPLSKTEVASDESN